MSDTLMGATSILKEKKLSDFNSHLTRLRDAMTLIGKNNITLNTSEPLGVGHSYGLDKKYSLNITQDKITFLNNSNQTIVVDDRYLNGCKWFQVYIYTVEIEFELQKIENHINDSLSLSELINGGL